MSHILRRFRHEQTWAKGIAARAVADMRARGVELNTRAGVGALTAEDLQAGGTNDAWADTFEMRRSMGIFDALTDVMPRIGLHRRAGLGSLISAGVVAENAAIPVSGFSLSGTPMSPLKVAAIVAFAAEALGENAALDLIERAAIGAVTLATDTKFVADLIAATSPAASTATADPDDVLQELGDLLALVATTGSEQLALMVDAVTANRLAVHSVNGIRSFPTMTPGGGTIAGIRTFASTAVPRESDGGAVVLVDAGRIAHSDEGAELSLSSSALLEMDSAPAGDSQGPTASSANLVSLFQTESVAIKIVRSFAHQLMDSDAVAVLNSCEWGAVP